MTIQAGDRVIVDGIEGDVLEATTDDLTGELKFYVLLDDAEDAEYFYEDEIELV